MSDITTKILYEGELEELDEKFHFLKNTDPYHSMFKSWHYTHTHRLGYENVKKLNVIFIGQTGYGKSSLINKLINKEVFETSDYQSCTKVLQSADYFLNHSKKHEKLAYVLSFVDLPGIGESDKEDEKYLQWYQDYINEASVIIYLFRADKRDHTQDEFFFKNVFNKNMSKYLTCVISQADKIEPLNRGNELSNDQRRNLENKVFEIANKPFLNFNDVSVIYISSLLNVNINDLKDEIIKKLTPYSSV
ncbi:GTPase family protein [Vibrio campbellii]|uniref:GTPase family protein n=1 Tax=Vibrio campbellii TaxID=680 RepID=UPI001F23B9FD|nr:GTPase [Vibrio campbellii]MCE7729338.1 50S ribosome-binding GTPase [Vibrio campbellii]